MVLPDSPLTPSERARLAEMLPTIVETHQRLEAHHRGLWIHSGLPLSDTAAAYERFSNLLTTRTSMEASPKARRRFWKRERPSR